MTPSYLLTNRCVSVRTVLPVSLMLVYPAPPRQALIAQDREVARGLLVVGIDQQDVSARGRPQDGEGGGDGGFPTAAFRAAGHQDHVGILLLTCK
jgi:hypothetical protein